ncbi:hypothetical protein BG006_005641, partial [Podila minutissima]
VPIPESVNITKVYVSRVALPEENVDPDQYISQGLQEFFAPFATVLKITLPKWISGHYSKYHLDAHVFLAPLQDEDEITFPEATADGLYEVPSWGHKIHTAWAKDAPCTYCKEIGHHRSACPELKKKVCHNCKKPGHTARMCRSTTTNR